MLKREKSKAVRRFGVLAGLLAIALALAPLSATATRVVSEKRVTGFRFPESCAYDPMTKSLYVGSFGGTELQTTAKDGQGHISRVSLDGKILDEWFLPAPGTKMNKPKGIWVDGNRLWVTDIDGVWEFDTTNRQGRKLDLPGAEFANDPAILGNTLYVSDNRTDALFSVAPADFLHAGAEPKVTQVWKGKGVNPNGIYPANDGSLLMVGSKSDKEKRGIFAMKPGGEPKPLSAQIGRLDGLYQMKDGTLIVTDWDSGSVFTWSEKAGRTTIATGFKGPADLCVVPRADGLTVFVPDLPASELRVIELAG